MVERVKRRVVRSGSRFLQVSYFTKSALSYRSATLNKTSCKHLAYARHHHRRSETTAGDAGSASKLLHDGHVIPFIHQRQPAGGNPLDD